MFLLRNCVFNRIRARISHDFIGGIALFLMLFLALPTQAVLASNNPISASPADTIASYTVEITSALASQHEVKVVAWLRPMGTVDLTVSSSLGGESGEQWVFIDRCYDQQNQPVNLEQVNNRTWRVNTASGITIEYRAKANIPAPMTPGSYLAYLSGDCGLIFAKSILLTPSTGGKVTVSFSLPEGWMVITDETWVPQGQAEYLVDTADFEALVAPGRWEVFEDTFGDGQKLRVAICGETRYPRGEYIKNVKVCLDYFHQKIGRLPQKEINVVVAPLPLPVDYMSGTPRLAVTRAVKSGPGSDWGMFEGMFWHYWFLKPVRYESQDDCDRAWWFGEGVSPFFLYPVYEKIGASLDVAQAWDFPQKELTWKNWYLIYERYRATKYNIALVDYPTKSRETSDVQYYFPLPYMKGSLVLHLLDASIKDATGGTRNITDVVKYLYENLVLKGIGYKLDDIMHATSEIAGSDYTAFFKAYVYGKENLPIVAAGQDCAIDWLSLGGKLYSSEPNSENASPMSGTAPVTLELKKESPHFAVYFHPQDEKMALLLLLGAQQAYPIVAKVFGGSPPLRIRMFLTYDRNEAAKFGYNPPGGIPEGASGGGPSSENGDELIWLNPISRNETQIRTDVMAHELGHCFMRQLYPGIYFTGIKDLSEVDEFVRKGLYNRNWLSWFSEGIADYTDIESWLDTAPDTPGPLLKAKDAFQQLVTSCASGTPPLVGLSQLEEAGKSDDQRLRHLFSAEGMTCLYYVTGKYGEDGLHRLLAEYSTGITLFEAFEKAFNTPFTELEKDWRALVEKTAAKLNFCDSELTRIRKQGYDTSKAERIKKQEPYLALFVAYVTEQYGVPGPIPTSLPVRPSPEQPRLPEASQPALPEQPPISSFPWPVLILFVVAIGAIVGIVIGIKKAVRSRR